MHCQIKDLRRFPTVGLKKCRLAAFSTHRGEHPPERENPIRAATARPNAGLPAKKQRGRVFNANECI